MGYSNIINVNIYNGITVREVVILLKRYTQIRVIHYIWELWNKLQY